MMQSLKDITRVVNGLFLVAKEAINRSQSESLIKATVLSAADAAGITQGKLRTFEPHASYNDNLKHDAHGNTRSSIVYFTDESPLHDPSASVSEAPLMPNADSNLLVSASLTPSDSNPCNTSYEGHQIVVPSTSNAPGNGPLTPNADSNLVASALLTPSDPNPCNTTNEGPQTVVPSTSNAPVNGGTVISWKQRKPKERRVPSTPFSRALGFAGLGAGLAWGTVQESAKRVMFGTPNSGNNQHVLSPYLSEKNAERLALALCRMRGAALKLGQMLSIQDESLVPAPILQALEIVRQGADRMPRNQLNQVLDAELGSNWSSKLMSFDYEPLAAASIGQVHRAVTRDGLEVAMKIQYPGVADSIESDIENVKLLLTYTNLLPEKLYIDSAMKVAKEELSRECDYELEAKNQKRFRSLLTNTKGFYVPFVVDNLSSRRVLTSELVRGIPIDKVVMLVQETRDHVGKKLLELTLSELFIFRFMQTDPNWSNFLYDETEKSINLVDFGAARDYPKQFVDDYLRMVLACANSDRETVIEMSSRLGFLTGMESEIMLEAHVQAAFVVGLPFAKHGGYDFGSTNITQSLSNLGATMLRHRLTPPPDEAYSLHRKLSGAFLACIKLQAVVPCRELLLQVYENYQFGDNCA